MAADDGSVSLEKLCHLCLAQPGIVALEIYINLGLSIFGLINNQFGIVLAHTLPPPLIRIFVLYYITAMYNNLFLFLEIHLPELLKHT